LRDALGVEEAFQEGLPLASPGEIGELLFDLISDDRVLVGVTDEGMGDIGHITLPAAKGVKALSKVFNREPGGLSRMPAILKRSPVAICLQTTLKIVSNLRQ
jgi:hypothetical protein